jgi:hypothetical protein
MNLLKLYRPVVYTPAWITAVFVVAAVMSAGGAFLPGLRYGTLIGGTQMDSAEAVAADAEGNMYVVSRSNSEITGEHNDMVLVKFNRIGEVEFMRVYGGTNGYFPETEEDYPNDIALDSRTNIIIVGETRSTDFPLVHPIQPPTTNTTWDGFILKVDPTGSEILFSTCLRGSDNDEIAAVTVDTADNIYVTGQTSSDDFILLNSAQTTNAGWTDAFVARITTNYNLDYSILYGGAGFEVGKDIVVDSRHHVTVLGDVSSGSSNTFHTSDNAIQTNFHQSLENGGDDFMLLQVNPTGTVTYASFLGGHEAETETAVALDLDNSDNLVIIGNTQAADYPVTNAYQAARYPGKDPYDCSIVVTRLNPDADSYLSSTYFGAAGHDVAYAGKVGADNAVYIAGTSYSTNFPLVNPQYPDWHNGFISRFDADVQALTWSTFWGGTNAMMYVRGLYVDALEGIYVVGRLGDADGFPITSDAAQHYSTGGTDGYLVKFIPKTAYDFDGDGRADPAVFYRAGGTWYADNSTAAAVADFAFGWNAVYLAAQDYDGDAVMDMAIFDPGAAEWYILQSRDQTLMEGGPVQFGWGGVLTVPADYDGDGRCDIGVFDPVTANWFIRTSSSGQLLDGGPIQFGWEGVEPVPADYDGDGKADVAVYNAPSGDWFIRCSSSGRIRHEQFGWAAAQSVPADYDRDNMADPAVYDAAGGRWFIMSSRTPGEIREAAFGWGDAVPVPADYDAFGTVDIAVYHQQNGNWFIKRSYTGQLRQCNWGWAAAEPVQQ